MCVVAIAARLIGVSTDRGLSALRTSVAADAGRLVRAPEAVAVLAGRRVDAGMQRRQLAGMAARADVERWRREAGVAMAGLARDLADVGDVTGARRDVAIRRRHVLGHAIFTRHAARAREHEQHEDAHHGRDPIA